MRRLPALLLALLVVTSGCAEYIPWLEQSPEPETNAQPVVNPPPGANTDWIFDAERLVSAHDSILAETNYRKEVRIRPNHSLGPREWTNVTLDAHVGEERIRIDQRGRGPSFGNRGSYTAYLSKNRMIWHVLPREDRPYHSELNTHLSIRKDIQSNAQVNRILSGSDFMWNGTTVRNGTKLYRYETSSDTELPDTKSLSATVFVDERGFVHELSGTLQTTGSRSVTANFSYEFSEAASPPTEPKWAEQVPQMSMHFESGIIAIEHEDGAVVPAGTTVQFTLMNDSNTAPGSVQLSKSFEPGDTAYLSVNSIERAERGQLTADGTVAINQPPANEPLESYSDWSVLVGISTDDWQFQGFNRSSGTD
ncbi:hypothetical protein ACFFQF_09860 [Haladaptatus pallidirubidus]|uniref:Uncharacterized protein n=1 Tax=Haladaptatus pallidirubidus TaxID=1008152 RepID=A0AAV3UFS6_9EURY|nr:hypothetical protein [Haladaptatus pallidirubidus]